MEGPEYSLTKTILEMDLVAYSDVARLLEENLNVEAVKAFQDQIQHFVDHGLEILDLKRDDIVMATAGDNAILMFDDAATMHKFAQAVQAHTLAHNASLSIDLAKRWFRMGAATGTILVIPAEHRIVGSTIARAVRLEAAAEIGQVVVDPPTFNSLPDELKKLYGAVETIKGKRSERFGAHRCNLIDISKTPVCDRLPFAFEDMGDQSVKNITRPVRSFRVTGFTRKLLSNTMNIPPSPDKPSIAVLAFTNVGGDSTYEYLSDGIADDIITSLSRCPWLFVISRNSSFTFKGRPVDVKQVGRELGVRYVLEGGVRTAGTRIRVTAQLVESETGAHVWASSFNKDLVDIFAVQDEISEAVSIAVAPAIADAEVRRALRKPDTNLDAWSAFQRGLWHFSKFNPDDNALAQKLFQQSIDFDPTFSGGYKGLCWSLCNAATVLLTHDLVEASTSAEALARRAVALDGADAEARSSLALTLWLQGDLEGAKAEAERALETSPNLAFAHSMFGAALLYSGQPREGIIALERAIRVDPYDPGLVSRLSHLAAAYYFDREYYDAIETAKRAIRSNPDYPSSYRWLAAGLGQLGRQKEAKKTLEKALAAAPTLVDTYVRKRPPWMRSEDHIHMLDGLRKAGLEC